VSNQKVQEGNGITFSMFLVIIIAMAIIIALSSAKIYLSNQIYYESKVVNKMKSEVSALRAEKRVLKHSAEALRFQTKVADTIFIIYESE